MAASTVTAASAASTPHRRDARAGAADIAFAPIAGSPRKGLWLGGLPPMHKQQAGISTYYQLSRGSTAPDRIGIRLRFEGVVADDALVRLNGIDGARLDPSTQRAEWRLKPHVDSEIGLTLAVPSGTSYLNVYTFQNGQGASRAFLLDIPPRGQPAATTR